MDNDGTKTVRPGELSIRDLPEWDGPAATAELCEQQKLYDSLYAYVNKKTMLRVSHDAEVLEQCHVETWPKALFSPVLVVGSGAGQGVKKLLDMGFSAYGSDIARTARGYYADCPDRFVVAEAHKLPVNDKSVGMLICCDVLEHIPEEYVDRALAEFVRVTKHVLLLSVGTGASIGIRDMHATVHPAEWWEAKFNELGAPFLGMSGDGHFGKAIEL